MNKKILIGSLLAVLLVGTFAVANLEVDWFKLYEEAAINATYWKAEAEHWENMYHQKSCNCGEAVVVYQSSTSEEFTPNPDVNNDGCVNIVDETYVTHSENWGRIDCVEPDWCNGIDINHDGKVGGVDLDYVLANFDSSCLWTGTALDYALTNTFP